MAGAYCQYCGHRCFVYRQVIDPPWSGHMATCAEGMAHDRAVLGQDADSAYNPADCGHACCDERTDPYHDHFLASATCPRCASSRARAAGSRGRPVQP